VVTWDCTFNFVVDIDASHRVCDQQGEYREGSYSVAIL